MLTSLLVIETIIQIVHLNWRTLSPSELDPNCRRKAQAIGKLFDDPYFFFVFVFSLSLTLLGVAFFFCIYIKLKGFSSRFGVSLEYRNIIIIIAVFELVYFVVCIFPLSDITQMAYRLVEEGQNLGIVTITTLVPVLQLEKHESQTVSKGSKELAKEFPEALFFWIPNHYFDSFLRHKYPSLVPYRPFLADILRYDY